MPVAPTQPNPPDAPPVSCWELERGDLLEPGRRIVRRLGGGAAHEAFLVATGGLPPRAAAKLPRPHLADDPHCLLRLRNEGEALDRLAHPTVPRHFGTRLWGPHPHLLLEHVPGPTLHDALQRRHSLSPALIAALGWALARGLAHIAGAGWVHLDVKPSNIVLNVAPRLIDFELARPAVEAALMRWPTGTWAYMAPEQRAAGRANAPAIGPAADVFGLAASLQEALAGRLLTGPSTPQPTGTRLGALLHDALGPEPGDRPTAAELADDLSRFAEPAPVMAAAG